MLGLLRDDISGIHILNVKVIYIKCPSNIILLTLPFKLTSVFMNIKNEVRINSEPHICVLSVYKSSKLTTCSLGFLFSFF